MKNLSEVLNEVMTDIFTESFGDVLIPQEEPTTSANLSNTAAPLGQAKQALLDSQKRAAFNATMARAGEKKQRFLDDQLHKSQENQPGFVGAQENPAPAEDPSYLKQLKQGASNLGSTIAQGATDAGNYLAQKGQEAVAAYQSMPGYLQYGIPAAALAAGAGALYLRKKQKAANKAAGIR